jgi:homoserine kinase type II
MTPSTAEIEAVLARAWGIDSPQAVPHDAGMNSRTWIVSAGTDRYVAKAVPAGAHDRFASGLAVATLVESAGIPAGAAVPTLAGEPWIRLAGGQTLAVLTFVHGTPLVGDDPAEQRLIGSTLARAHRALIGRRVPDLPRFHWIDLAADHLGLRDWVRPAIVDAVAEWERLPPDSLTWGLIHTDPAPEAFLRDADTGVVGLIDWDTGMIGPLMYDLASAAMYVGGPERAGLLLGAYLDHGPLGQLEVDRTMELILRMRWAVQADYFARRIAAHDLTGIRDPIENEQGLDDARRGLGR